MQQIICCKKSLGGYDEKLSMTNKIPIFSLFSNTYNQVQKKADMNWKFRRYSLINEYENRPILPPPLTALYLFYWLLQRLRHCFCCIDSRDRQKSKETRSSKLRILVIE